MKITSFKIIEEYYEGHGDVFAVLGKSRSGKKTLAPYVVGFCSRHEDELSDVERFMDLDSAKKRLLEMVYEEEQPDETMSFLEDFQQDEVYRWEDDFIAPHSAAIKRKEALALIERVCNDYGMRLPRLVWTKPQEYSYYHEEDHAIHFGHRDFCTLLHELAHVMMCEKGDGPEDHANHCPRFVWETIELYNRYGNFPLDYLIQSANGRDLLGPIDVPTVTAPQRDLRMA